MLLKKYLISLSFLLLNIIICSPFALAEKQNGFTVAQTKSIDLSPYFKDIQGAAVFYTPSTKVLEVFQEERATTQVSPFSTFKIISTLLGLEQGIIHNKNDKMKYNGTKYWLNAWNKDVNLQEAFKYSCVWYYHQLIYKLKPKQVAVFLNDLSYGNADISEWKGNGKNAKEDLNGFWLASSLKISPLEQIKVLWAIFEGKTKISKANIQLVQDLMKQNFEKQSGLYAKTGSNGRGISWLVGFLNTKQGKKYFAILVNDPKSSASQAKEIALQIFN